MLRGSLDRPARDVPPSRRADQFEVMRIVNR